MKRFLSYSQEYEDWILFNALKGVENGFYIDVGANDPWFFSVTKVFYDRGWRGINIEPLPEEYQYLCEDRPRDINLNIGAGDREGELEFSIAGMATTCDLQTLDDARSFIGLNRDSFPKKRIRVSPLTKILEEHLPEAGQTIHFCKIDVEGFEGNVLMGLDFSRFRPWIVVMEAAIVGTEIPSHERWEHLLTENGYDFACQHGINRYYIDARNSGAEELKKNFSEIKIYDADRKLFKVMIDREPPVDREPAKSEKPRPRKLTVLQRWKRSFLKRWPHRQS